MEALLRLRQAACHQGLLDKDKINAGSAKLDALLEQISEVVAGGHKCLVFSQFTSFLKIVRPALVKQDIDFCYLDGKTNHRKKIVNDFQTNENKKVFLISLKAGGLGLNLTAADYVFILDPWWNPAAESQAIDRSHRLGQNKKVFAYKLIAEDTVEDKIIKLQETKKGLSEALINNNTSFLKRMTVEDLDFLLS